MPPLPFNLGADAVLRRSVSAALFVAPALLTLASLVPFTLLTNWVMASAGMSPHASVRYHPSAEIVQPLMALAAGCFCVAGYVAGWLVNGLFLFWLRRWPWSEVCDALLRSRLPASWRRAPDLRQDQLTKLKNEFDCWALERQSGWRKYLGAAVFKIGFPFAGSLLFVRWLGRDAHLAGMHWMAVLLLGIFLGAFLGAFFWSWREHRYLYRAELLNEA